MGRSYEWIEHLLEAPYEETEGPTEAVLQLIHQDFEELERNESIIHTPLTLGDRRFERGLGTHSNSHIRVYSPEPIARFRAWVGVDHNERTKGGVGSVAMRVVVGETEVFGSRVHRGGEDAERLDVAIEDANVLDLYVGDAGDGQGCDHADWAEAELVTAGGETIRLDELKDGVVPTEVGRYPFSFTYGGRPSGEVLDEWPVERTTQEPDAERMQVTTTWTDPESGLKLEWVAVRYADFPAAEWVLYFENTGDADTDIISDIQAMDVGLTAPLRGAGPAYLLHASRGGTPDPEQFEPHVLELREPQRMVLGSGSGRSSTENLPFFKVEGAGESVVGAIGWSGCWQATFECPDRQRLRMRGGMERTHFRLHPGERVRSPRILLLHWTGDTLESNAQFRQLIYKHYCAKRDGETPLPLSFCNTCFTRGGGWLNECNAENQISLIRAYSKLGLDALLTDAGWFTGGWPAGAGNWDPRQDAYPEGMGPVAAAAKEEGMIYGLWFEPERVVAGTQVHRDHPEWCLGSQHEPQGTYLLNFGLPEVQDHFYGIVKGFMELPGFRVYRQDFNMDPLAYWRFNDAEDRQGITEIRYIEGLYAYWDRIRSTWPDAFMEECASGGHRIDLETVMRMHAHQKTDYWFNDDVDQAALWSVSQYLPNNTIVAHLNNLDTYSFHSALASSLCLGWIADAPDFDFARGKEFLNLYDEVRHLLVGAWYPLLPYSREADGWTGSQFHRPDLNEGLILLFRHANSPHPTVEVKLQGLDAEATYELRDTETEEAVTVKGEDLMSGYEVRLGGRRESRMLVYGRR